MTVSLNRVALLGHLGRDPEVRTLADGRTVANLSLATSERWTDRTTNELRERTEWHRVAVLNSGLAGVVEPLIAVPAAAMRRAALASSTICRFDARPAPP